MRNRLILLVIILANVGFWIWYVNDSESASREDNLRSLYTADISEWPVPTVEDSLDWEPLSALPKSPYRRVDSLASLTKLGKMLFFDPRLSSSNQISCSSCHDPNLAWTDGLPNSLGHDHLTGNRNAPSLLNVWAKKPLFWDGRAKSLAEQIHHPINNPIEMNQNAAELPPKLQAINGYPALFAEAYDDSTVTLPHIAEALAQFQRTLQSRSSDFDQFVRGDEDAMTDQEILGLHLFRTKARCMNCHYGPFFTDMKFHNLGLHYYGREREDLGLYNITENPADVGKFRTPQLRDVAFTKPWFHNGLIDTFEGLVNMYNHGMARPKPRPGMKNDPPYPTTSPLLKELHLTDDEMDAIIAFLKSISERSYRMPRPELPGR